MQRGERFRPKKLLLAASWRGFPPRNLGQKAKLNRILAEVCETLDGRCDTDTLCTQLKLQCAEAVYKHNIALAGKRTNILTEQTR